MSLNQVQLIGFLGQDPEKRVTKTGKEVYTLSVATSTKRKQDDGTVKEFTEWHKITVFNQTAFMQYLKKGDLVFIRGRLHYSKDEVDGVTRYFTQIHCEEIQRLNAREQTDNEQSKPPATGDNFDDDIPY